MRYELSERIRTTLPAAALQDFLAERCSRIAAKTHRAGDAVELSGVENSFGSINRSTKVRIGSSNAWPRPWTPAD